MQSIHKRGIPNYQDPIHLIRQDQHNMLCYNGSYHVFYTDDLDRVTCQACLEKLRKAGRLKE